MPTTVQGPPNGIPDNSVGIINPLLEQPGFSRDKGPTVGTGQVIATKFAPPTGTETLQSPFPPRTSYNAHRSNMHSFSSTLTTSI
ncbi:hypothetical protein AWENTII_000034 [Aspergillus wentii]